MNCKRAQLEIALWVGGDLDDSSAVTLQRHLTDCSPCHRHWERLKNSFQRLRKPTETADDSLHDSLWPNLLTKLRDCNREPQLIDFNGWLPAVAVIAASIAILAFWQKTPSLNSSAIAAESMRLPPVQRPITALPAPLRLRVGSSLFVPEGAEEGDFGKERSEPQVQCSPEMGHLLLGAPRGGRPDGDDDSSWGRRGSLHGSGSFK